MTGEELISLEEAERIAAAHEEARSAYAGMNSSQPGGPWPEPIPLMPSIGVHTEYPASALGMTLENAARGIADITQCPLGIAANAVLAVASLASQAHADVKHPATGRSLPLSLFLLTIAESGERKTAADREALAPIREQEKSMADAYRPAYAAYLNKKEAWDATRNKLKAKSKGDKESLVEALASLGPAPTAPLIPQLVMTEPTYEGLVRLYREGYPALGLFSAEGGGFLGGHALRDDSKLRTLTGLSDLWDGSPVKRTRAGEGPLHLEGRRLAMHLMIQPAVASLLLGDDLASGQGFLSRLLVSYPASTQGQRFQREPAPWARQSIDVYHKAIRDLLERPLPVTTDNELTPRLLGLTPEAEQLWKVYADDRERELRAKDFPLAHRGLHNKSAELALRVAGVLAMADERDTSAISDEVFRRACQLIDYYLAEARRLYEGYVLPLDLAKAQKLLEWLIQRGDPCVNRRVIQVGGPHAIRRSGILDRCLKLLQEYGWCRILKRATGSRPTIDIEISPHAANAWKELSMEQ